MPADPRELLRLRTFFVAGAGTRDLRAAFVIDGRRYRDPDAVRADVVAAFDALQHRRLIAEFITRPVRPDSPNPNLPSWEDYKTAALACSLATIRRPFRARPFTAERVDHGEAADEGAWPAGPVRALRG